MNREQIAIAPLAMQRNAETHPRQLHVTQLHVTQVQQTKVLKISAQAICNLVISGTFKLNKLG
jgi:hypothetical protein